MVLPSQVKKSRKNFLSQKKKRESANSDAIYDIYQKAERAVNAVKRKTGVVYDEYMTSHNCLWDPQYPECPERLESILHRCNELGLLSRCEKIQSRCATPSEVLKKHNLSSVSILEKTEQCSDIDKLERLSSCYDAIYFHSSTYKCALLAAGSCIELVDAICRGHVQNGMAIVRPPGHHAMESAYCGYCFFNNVALAAQHALDTYQLSRILIVDWDVHHGQGTQQLFYDDPRVLYFSIHRYENGLFWPNLRESEFDYIGKGRGRGFNINVPLNKTGLGDADYLAIFQHILLPVAYEYQPEMVLVSAGYDAAYGCPEGEMLVTAACYAHLLGSLMGLANGKLAVILEGGYCLKSLAESASLTLRGLLGDPCPVIPPLDKPDESVCETILNVSYAHRRYWNCLRCPFGSFSTEHDEKCAIRTRHKWRHMPVAKFQFSGGYPTFFETRNCYPVQDPEFVLKANQHLDKLISETKLLPPTHQVCYVYDTAMLKHRNSSQSDHPEKPERIVSIYEMFKEYGLLERMHKLESRHATKEELLSAHTSHHVQCMMELKCSSNSSKELHQKARKYSSVYFHRDTYDCATLAAGSLLQVVDSVLSGESGRGVAVVRPPGHHADETKPCGFCIFNNVAVAATYAINTHGLKRVLIVDWDIHHGNGTQKIFENDAAVLYISIHRFDNGTFFPGNLEGDYTYVGIEDGVGFNVNIPWNEGPMRDEEYIMAFHRVILPIAYQFNPEIVFVSAGFDAAIGDPLGGYNVTPEAYAHFTQLLMPLAGGRIILCLEGGYNVRSVAYSMTMCVKTLLNDPLPMLDITKPPKDSAVASLKKVASIQSTFWPSLKLLLRELPAEDMALPDANVPSVKENRTYPSEDVDAELVSAFGNISICNAEQISHSTTA